MVYLQLEIETWRNLYKAKSPAPNTVISRRIYGAKNESKAVLLDLTRQDSLQSLTTHVFMTKVPLGNFKCTLDWNHDRATYTWSSDY